jgi:hypothetical protein
LDELPTRSFKVTKDGKTVNFEGARVSLHSWYFILDPYLNSARVDHPRLEERKLLHYHSSRWLSLC